MSELNSDRWYFNMVTICSVIVFNKKCMSTEFVMDLVSFLVWTTDVFESVKASCYELRFCGSFVFEAMYLRWKQHAVTWWCFVNFYIGRNIIKHISTCLFHASVLSYCILWNTDKIEVILCNCWIQCFHLRCLKSI